MSSHPTKQGSLSKTETHPRVEGDLGASLTESSSVDLKISELKLKSQTVRSTQVNFPTLQAGVYFWRIQARHPTLGEWKPSHPFRFRVRNRIAPPKTKGVTILPDESALTPSFRSRMFAKLLFLYLTEAQAKPANSKPKQTLKLLFEWDPAPGASSYRLEISSSEDFKELIHTEEVNGTEKAVTIPRLDKIYWRVRSKDARGTFGKASPIEEIVLNEKTKPSAEKAAPEISKVVPPSAQPAPQIPHSKTPQPLKKRSKTLAGVALGLGGLYGFENAEAYSQAEGFRAEIRGFSFNRYVLDAHMRNDDLQFQAQILFQPLRYNNDNSVLADFQGSLYYNYWAFRLLASHFSAFPLTIGLSYSQEPFFSRLANQAIFIKRIHLPQFVLGTTLTLPQIGSFASKIDFSLLLAPFGQMRGLSIDSKWRVQIPPYSHALFRSTALVSTRLLCDRAHGSKELLLSIHGIHLVWVGRNIVGRQRSRTK